MRKFYLYSIYIFLIFIFAILYFSLDNKKIYNTEDMLGSRIVEIELNILGNDDIFNTKEISNYEYTLQNFWASWGGPCRKEHKNLMKLSKNKNLKIIGINFKDDKINAENFLKKMGNPFFISTVDPKGIKSVNFGIYGIPETILLNQELEILKKYVGPIDLKDVNEIRKIINE